MNNKDFVELLVSETIDPSLALPDPTLLQYYDDLKNRVIWINEEIDGDTLDIVSKIIYWNREDRALPENGRKPIRIFFNSPGGSLDVEETVVSMINVSKTPVYGYALGLVASAASMIYLACHKRFALHSSYFIFHQGGCENVGGSFAEVQAMMDDYKIQVQKMEKFYIEHTLFTEEEVKQNIVKDWYLRGDILKEKGVITDWVDDISVFFQEGVNTK